VRASEDARASKALGRLRRGRPVWHTVSCTCDDCLDMDLVIVVVGHWLAGRRDTPVFGKQETGLKPE
jgi:hypothetical protein